MVRWRSPRSVAFGDVERNGQRTPPKLVTIERVSTTSLVAQLSPRVRRDPRCLEGAWGRIFRDRVSKYHDALDWSDHRTRTTPRLRCPAPLRFARHTQRRRSDVGGQRQPLPVCRSLQHGSLCVGKQHLHNPSLLARRCRRSPASALRLGRWGLRHGSRQYPYRRTRQDCLPSRISMGILGPTKIEPRLWIGPEAGPRNRRVAPPASANALSGNPSRKARHPDGT
jgi:hypothetical protein